MDTPVGGLEVQQENLVSSNAEHLGGTPPQVSGDIRCYRFAWPATASGSRFINTIFVPGVADIAFPLLALETQMDSLEHPFDTCCAESPECEDNHLALEQKWTEDLKPAPLNIKRRGQAGLVSIVPPIADSTPRTPTKMPIQFNDFTDVVPTAPLNMSNDIDTMVQIAHALLLDEMKACHALIPKPLTIRRARPMVT